MQPIGAAALHLISGLVLSHPVWATKRLFRKTILAFPERRAFLLQSDPGSWRASLLIRGVAGADLQGPRRRLFVKLLFISFIKSSSCPPKEPRTVALDSHITLVSFAAMIYCLI